MPWEKSFDIDDAVDLAMTVFSKKGYEATSVSDLTEGMRINKGSLYNAFGSKKELFSRVLLKYDVDKRQRALASLEAMDEPVRAIALLFDGLIAESGEDTDRKGCLLVNTALEMPSHDDDVREIVTKALGDFEGFFKRLIVRGQKRGSIPRSVKAGQTAKSLLGLVVGLRVLARGVYDVRALRAIKKDALRLVSE